LVTIECRESDPALAQQALDILKEALEEFSPRLSSGREPVRVVICHSQGEFARHAGPYAQLVVAGIARAEEGLIVVKAPALLHGGAEFRLTLRHELVHVLLARNVNTDRLPRWLNEGITMMLSGDHRWASSLRVAHMYLEGNLIRYPELAFALEEPGSETEFSDAYAQSLSMTRYLARRLGEERFWALVRALDARSFGRALQETAGLTPYEFWKAWRDSLWNVALASSIVSGLSLFQVMVFLSVWVYLRNRRVGQAILRKWEEEEAAAAHLAEDRALIVGTDSFSEKRNDDRANDASRAN
jgi:hypothetical protein